MKQWGRLIKAKQQQENISPIQVDMAVLSSKQKSFIANATDFKKFQEDSISFFAKAELYLIAFKDFQDHQNKIASIAAGKFQSLSQSAVENSIYYSNENTLEIEQNSKEQ